MQNGGTDANAAPMEPQRRSLDLWEPPSSPADRLREMGHAELAEGADTGPRQSTRSIYTGDVLAPYHPSQPTNAAPRSRGTGPRSHAAILTERELAEGFERARRSGRWRRQAAALADRLREMGHAELAEGAERHAELLRIDNGPDSDLFIESYLRRFDPAHPAFDPDPRGYLRAHDPPPPSPPRSTASGEEAPVHRGAGAREAVKEQPQVSQATCTRFAPRPDQSCTGHLCFLFLFLRKPTAGRTR